MVFYILVGPVSFVFFGCDNLVDVSMHGVCCMCNIVLVNKRFEIILLACVV